MSEPHRFFAKRGLSANRMFLAVRIQGRYSHGPEEAFSADRKVVTQKCDLDAFLSRDG